MWSCLDRKAAAVTTLFDKVSGTASGGTIESLINQLSTEPYRDQAAAAHPYSLNPSSSRYSLHSHNTPAHLLFRKHSSVTF